MKVIDKIGEEIVRDRKEKEELVSLQHFLSNKVPEWDGIVYDAVPPYFEKPRLHLEKADPKKRTFLLLHKVYVADLTINLEHSEIEIEASIEDHDEVKPLAILIAEEMKDFEVILNT